MKLNYNKKKFTTFTVFLGIIAATLIVSSFGHKTQTANTNPQIQARVLGANTEAVRGEHFETKKMLPRKIEAENIILTNILASAYSVIDENSGIDLLEKQPHLKLRIASLTKLMTSLIAYEKLSTDEYVEITGKDIMSIAPTLTLRTGDEVKILNLIEAALVCSANDAGRALANHVQKKEGQDFTEMMNEKARVLKLFETNFSNPLGFDSGENFSSINDLKSLVKYTQQFAIFKNLGKTTQVAFVSKAGRIFSCNASNKLVGKNMEVENIKTGYTAMAKGSIIARVRRGEKSLLVFILGSDERERDLLQLSEKAFNSFVWE